MPETPKTNSQQAQDAQTAANAAKATAEANKTAWQAEKERMKNWLKTNVGQNLDTGLNHLKDTLIDRAASARGVSTDYLQKSFDHLKTLTDDPNWTWDQSVVDAIATQQHVNERKNGTPAADNQSSPGT